MKEKRCSMSQYSTGRETKNVHASTCFPIQSERLKVWAQLEHKISFRKHGSCIRILISTMREFHSSTQSVTTVLYTVLLIKTN